MKYILIFYFSLSASFLWADTITVKNKSDFDIYAATYYFDDIAQRVSEVKIIPAEGVTEFERPPSKGAPLIGSNRKLAFSF